MTSAISFNLDQSKILLSGNVSKLFSHALQVNIVKPLPLVSDFNDLG